MKKRSLIALSMAVIVSVSTLMGCGSKDSSTSGKKQVVEFWYHAADEKSNKAYEELIAKLNASQDEYEYRYTGFASKDFPDKFQMAIATKTMPDVISTGFGNVMTYVAQDALVDLASYYDKWDEKSDILPQTFDSLKALGGGKIYGIPFNYDQQICYYNPALFEANGITEVPTTQAKFLELTEQFGNREKGTYFYSLRGVKPSDNLFAWIFTYTDGAGYKGSFFDENNQCIINKPEFVEALDVYASIYKNNWVSGDSVNNDFNEMNAEFSAGTSMFVMHNSSGRRSISASLGEGNFKQTKPLANEQGRYYAPSMQPQVYCVTNNKGADANYDGAVKLCQYLAGKEAVSELCQVLGRTPVNTACYEADWYKQNAYYPLYGEIMNDPNYVQIQNPYWLMTYANFIKSDMTTDFQALLLGEKSAQQVLDKWAQFLTEEQAKYLQDK